MGVLVKDVELALAQALASGQETQKARILGCEITANRGRSKNLLPVDATIEIALRFNVIKRSRITPVASVELDQERGQAFWILPENLPTQPIEPGEYTVSTYIRPHLLAMGTHTVSVALLDNDGREGRFAEQLNELVSFIVVECSDPEGAARGPYLEHATGRIRPAIPWSRGVLPGPDGSLPSEPDPTAELEDDARVTLLSVRFTNSEGAQVQQFESGDQIAVELIFEVEGTCIYCPNFGIFDTMNQVLFRSVPLDHRPERFLATSGVHYSVVWLPTEMLRGGTYILEVGASDPRTRPLRRYVRENFAARFKIVEPNPSRLQAAEQLGSLRVPVHWGVARPLDNRQPR